MKRAVKRSAKVVNLKEAFRDVPRTFEPPVTAKDVHDLIRKLAELEPNDRKKRFLIACSIIICNLCGNDMDEIEPTLTNAIGRTVVAGVSAK